MRKSEVKILTYGSYHFRKIGETNRNNETRWAEHEDYLQAKSEPARHLKENGNHKFAWNSFFCTFQLTQKKDSGSFLSWFVKTDFEYPKRASLFAPFPKWYNLNAIQAILMH